jgi:hypothetical protein
MDKIIKNRFRSAFVPWGILIVVAIVELHLCVQYHRERWIHVISPRVSEKEHVGEGLVIQWNGLGYYAWLRSLLIDGDWDFTNEFEDHNPFGHYVPPRQFQTSLGRRANQWSVGPACLWAVVVAPVHLVLKTSDEHFGAWAADGYSLPYQLLVGATSFAASLLSLTLLYGICRTQARPSRAALSVALLVLGSTIVYYQSIEISLPHGIGTTVFAGLVYYWLTTYGSLSPRRWFLVGILTGLSALVRWQLATFAILFIAEGLLIARKDWKYSWLPCLSAVGAITAFVPQMIAWRFVYGTWLASPIEGVTYHWLTPSFWAILFSQDRSLFYWTPITALACIGACRSGRSQGPLPILAIAFVVQVYALAGMWGQGDLLERTGNYGGVFLARSYGFRDLTESLVVLAPGFAGLLEQASPRRFRILAGLGLLMASWNLMLVNLYTKELIPAMAGATPYQLVSQATEIACADSVSIAQAVLSSFIIGILLTTHD